MGACCGFIKPSVMDSITIEAVSKEVDNLDPKIAQAENTIEKKIDEKGNKPAKGNKSSGKYKLIDANNFEKHGEVRHSNSKTTSEITGIENAEAKNGKDDSKSVLDLDNSLSINVNDTGHGDHRRDPEDEYRSPNEKKVEGKGSFLDFSNKDGNKTKAEKDKVEEVVKSEKKSDPEQNNTEKTTTNGKPTAATDRSKEEATGKKPEAKEAFNIEAKKAEVKNDSRMTSGYFGEQKDIKKQMSELKKQVSNLPEVTVDKKKYNANNEDKAEEEKNLPLKRYKTMNNPSDQNKREHTENEEKKETRTIQGGENDSLVLETETNRSGFRKSLLKKQNTMKDQKEPGSSQKRVKFDLGGQKPRIRKKSRKR